MSSSNTSTQGTTSNRKLVVGPFTAEEYRHHLRLLDLEQECRSRSRWLLFWQVVGTAALALLYRPDIAALISRL